MIKQQGLHEGIWGLYVEFGISAANLGLTENDILPAAIVPIIHLGITKFPSVNNLSVDAAVVNPKID